jgi:hypothetical protein
MKFTPRKHRSIRAVALWSVSAECSDDGALASSHARAIEKRRRASLAAALQRVGGAFGILSIATHLSAAEPQNISTIQSLKPGKGRELIQINCIPCHSTAIIAATHATRARWDELITTMQQKHGLWPLVPSVRNQILDYLATTQPPSDPALDAAKQTPWAEPLYRPNPLW